MRAWHRFVVGSLVASTALAVACGGQTSGPGGGGGGSGGACDRLFDVFIRCSTVGYPADEVSRLRGRWATLCGSALALPGVGLTPDALDACVAAINANGCSDLSAGTGACVFTTGSLPSGSTCATDSQCQSGTCNLMAGDGGFSSCGTCYSTSGIGQACMGRSCGAGAACAYAGGNGDTCVAVTLSGAGGTCDGQAHQCDPGLVCGTTTHACAAPGAAGTPCNYDSDCAASLVCPPSATGGFACASPGQAGARCTQDTHCATGLGCDTNAGTCGPVTYVAAGQACSGSTRCLVGSCPFNAGTGGNGGTVSGTCPSVIPDGQPCNAHLSDAQSCDTFANCENGVCVLGYAGLCN
jgi:hypothetical protein